MTRAITIFRRIIRRHQIATSKYFVGRRSEMIGETSDILRAQGIPHAPAKYDEAGLCLTCRNDATKCPGVHTFEEIQEAGRKAAGKANQK